MHAVGSALVTAATLPLALGLAGDLYVVIGKIIGPETGLYAAGFGLIVLIGLWYAYPLAAAAMRPEEPRVRAQVKASGQRS